VSAEIDDRLELVEHQRGGTSGASASHLGQHPIDVGQRLIGVHRAQTRAEPELRMIAVEGHDRPGPQPPQGTRVPPGARD